MAQLPTTYDLGSALIIKVARLIEKTKMMRDQDVFLNF